MVGVVALILGLPAGGSAVADGPSRTYWKYRDADGVLHITNSPPTDRQWRSWNVDQPRPRTTRSRKKRSRARERRRTRSMAAKTDVESRRRAYERHIVDAAKRFDLPAALLRAVIHTESRFRADAVSSAGAKGLMQLMPKTARGLGVRDSFDPRENIMGGGKFLRMLANRYDGDAELMLAAYHAGAGAVKKYGGVPPYASTRAYVPAVLRRFHAYARRERAWDPPRSGSLRNVQP